MYGITRTQQDRRFIQPSEELTRYQHPEWEDVTEPVIGKRPSYISAGVQPQAAGYGPAVATPRPPRPQAPTPSRPKPDQWEDIGYMEEAPTMPGRVLERWKLGQLNVELGLLESQGLLGDTSPEIQQRIAEIETLMPRGERRKRMFAERMATESAEMAPIMVEGIKRGVERGVILGGGLAAITAAVGQIPPLTFLPEEFVTVPGAAAAGYTVGMTSAMLESIGRIEAGLAYNEFKNIKDPKTGQTLDPAVARWTALGVGAVNALLELFQIKLLMRAIPGGKTLLRAATNGAVKKVITGTPLKRLAFRATKYAGVVSGETLQEVAQESSNIIGQAVATEITNRVKGTKIAHQTKQEIVDRLKDVAESSMYAFSLMALPHAGGVRAPAETVRAEDAPVDVTAAPKEPEHLRVYNKIVADVQSGAINVENLEGSADLYRQRYPDKLPQIQALENHIAKMGQVETPGIREGLVPVAVTGELARKPAEEAARTFEEAGPTTGEFVDEEEATKQSREGLDLLEQQLTEEEAIQAAAEQEVQPIPYEEMYPEAEEMPPAPVEEAPPIAFDETFEPIVIEDILGVDVIRKTKDGKYVLWDTQPGVDMPVTGVYHDTLAEAADEVHRQAEQREMLAGVPEEYMEEREEGEVYGIPEGFDEEIERRIEKEKAPSPAAEIVDEAAQEAEEPTPAQAKAGVYKKGHIKLHGLAISIENPIGSVRQGISGGKAWRTVMKHHYGYFPGYKGKDKDHVDVFIGQDPESDRVFVIDQMKVGILGPGKFDEHKVMMGFATEEQARVGYMMNYEKGWRGLGNITEFSVDEFTNWLKTADKKKPAAEVEVEIAPEKAKEPFDRDVSGDILVYQGRIEGQPIKSMDFTFDRKRAEGFAKAKTKEGKPIVDTYKAKDFPEGTWIPEGEEHPVSIEEYARLHQDLGYIEPEKVKPIAEPKAELPPPEAAPVPAVEEKPPEVVAPAPKKKEARRERFLIPWIASVGGIRTTDPAFKGELRMIATAIGRGKLKRAKGIPPGFFNTQSPWTMDTLVDEAITAGFLPPGADENDLLTAIQKDLAGATAQDEFARAIRMEEAGSEEYLDKLTQKYYREQEELSEHEQRQVSKAEEDVRADLETELEEEANREEISNFFQDIAAEREKFRLEPTEPTPAEKIAIRKAKGEIVTPEKEKKRAVIPTEKIKPPTKGEQVGLFPRPGEQVRIEEAAPPLEEVKEPWQMTREEIEGRYPRVKETVDGRLVRADIPNQASITASIDTPTVLKGVREVSMSEFDAPPAINTKTRALANSIKESGEITPLIVVIDKEGPYVLEGANRYDALKILKAESMPALIVLDEGSLFEAVKQAISEGKTIPKEVLADYPELKAEEKPAPPAVAEEIEEVVEEVEEEAKLPVGTPAALMKMADWVARQIESISPIAPKNLFEQANLVFKGTMAQKAYTIKDAYDALELGTNLFIYREGPITEKVKGELEHTYDPRNPAGQARANVLSLKARLDKVLPTQTKRTQETDEFQQFSTPPYLAYVANWAANLQRNDFYLEPSAGTGNLSVFASIVDIENIALNELSERRMQILKVAMGRGHARQKIEYFTEDAAQLNNILPSHIKPTVVVMNPPFSSTAGRLKANKTMYGARHIEQALKRLEPNGRLVAIVGKGMAMDAPAFSTWWSRIRKEYNVRANIEISGQEYRKFGTTFDNRIIVIDKVVPSDYPIVKGRVEKVEDLIDLLSEVRDARITPTERERVEPARKEVPPAREVKPGPESQLQLPIGDLGRPARAPEGVEPIPGRGAARPGELRPGRAEGRPGEGPGRGPLAISREEVAAGRVGERLAEQPGRPAEGEHPLIPEGRPAALEVKAQEAPPKKPAEFTDAVFEEYSPQRVEIPNAQDHKYPLVESSAMASVLPPKVTYKPALPSEVITSGALSKAQLESIIYAGQAHSEVLPDGRRKGYMCGDGTGVGKGREIAAIMWDNWNQGRKKAIWVSQNKGLMDDAKRDVGDIGFNPDLVIDYGKTKMGEVPKAKQGIMFVTFSTLCKKDVKTGKSRLDALINWFGKDFDGAIIFDEAHNMGNALAVRGDRGMTQPSQTAIAGVELQDSIPNARIAYFSATGATELKNYTYATRLGLWGEGTPFPTGQRFVAEVERGGMAAMEMIARDMKQMGVYGARALSYKGIKYERAEHKVRGKQAEYYNEFARAWQLVHGNIGDALEVTDGDKSGRARGAAMSRFWAEELRFFNQVLTSFQVPTLIKSMEKDLEAGHAPVIQFVNTNEAQQNRARARMQNGDEIEDLDISPREIIINLVEKSFPTTQFHEVEDDEGNKIWVPVFDSEGNPVQNAEAVAMREALLDRLAGITEIENPLDQILLHFGSDKVAEVTGRGARRNYDEKGKMILEKRSPGKVKSDVSAFLDDRKKILMFSYAGGIGSSYHPDLRFENQRLRRHYLLQPGWQANRALQGLGRTHRTNQKQAPEVILTTTDLKGHTRFISSIARKLDQLGALTRGTRKGASQGLFAERDNLESMYANAAVRGLIEDMFGGRETRMTLGEYEKQAAITLVNPDGGLNTTKIPPTHTFLNRLLHMEIDMQNKVFDLFSERLDTQIQIAIEDGSLDVGMETLRGDEVKKISEQNVYTDKKTGAQTKFVELDVKVPAAFLPYETAKAMASEGEGFYRNTRSGKLWAAFPMRQKTDARTGEVTAFHPLRSPTYTEQTVDRNVLLGELPKEVGPLVTWAKKWANKTDFEAAYNNLTGYNTLTKDEYGVLKQLGSPVEVALRNIGIGSGEIGKLWELMHPVWQKVSDKDAKGEWEKTIKEAPHDVTKRYNLITGVLLPIWDRLKGHARIIRTQTEKGERLIGRLVNQADVSEVIKNLGAERSDMKVTSKQIAQNVIAQNTEYVLANGWKIHKRTVSGEERIEVTGPDPFQGRELVRHGVFTERIGYQLRYFIPTGPEAVGVIDYVLQSRPVVDVIDKPKSAEETRFAIGKELADQYLTVKSAAELQEVTRMVVDTLHKHLPVDALERITLELKPFANVPIRNLEKTLTEWSKALNIPLERITGAHLLGATGFKDMMATMQISYMYGKETIEKTTHHEIFHVAAKWLLPDPDYKGLLKFYDNNEEIAAKAYADWAMKRKAKGYKIPDSFIKRLFVRLRRYFILLRNALTGKGYMRVEDIFGKIYTKQYYRLIPKRVSETRFAIDREATGPQRKWAEDYFEKILEGKPIAKEERKAETVDKKLARGPKEEDRPKIPSTFEEGEDDWLGNKDWAEQVHTVEAKRIQEEIANIVGDKNVFGQVYFSKRCEEIDQAIHIYLDTKRNPGHVEEFWEDLNAEQRKTITLAGQVEDNPRLVAIANYIRKQYDKLGQMALSEGVIFNVIDNYAGRAWKIPGKMATDVMQKFKTTTRHAKHRVFETVIEGWATRQMELQVTGASNNLALVKDEISRVVEDKRLIKQLGSMAWRDTELPVISVKQENPDYVAIEHPNFTRWIPFARIKAAELVKQYGREFRVQAAWGAIKEGKTRATRLLASKEEAQAWIADQAQPEIFRIESRHTLWKRHVLYAPKEVARKLNAVLGVSRLKGVWKIRDISVIDTITKYNAIMKSMILMTGLFHHQAFMRSYLFGTRHKTAAEWNVIKMYKEGLKAINSLAPEIQLLVRNGLTLGKMQDWEETILRQEDTIFGKILAKHPYTNEFREWVNRLRERQGKFLFQRFGAGLKARAALIELRNALKDPKNTGMEIEDIAKMVADLINDDFGGLHLRRMHRDPTVQHIFRLLALAPDWTESNVNTAWKSFIGGTEQRRHFYRRFWASVLTKGLMATTAANILLSFWDDDDLIARYKKAWRAGNLRWLDIDITPLCRLFTDSEPEARRYLSILGHFKDPIKFALHLFRSAMHKSSVFARVFLSFMFAIDWKGHGFTTIDEFIGVDDKGLYLSHSEGHKIGEPKGGKRVGKLVTPMREGRWGITYAQIPSYLMEQLRGMTPIQVQAIITRMMGEIDSFDMLMRMMGAHYGRTWPTKNRLTKDWADEWVRLKRSGGSFIPLRKRIDAYNEHQLRLGKEGEPIPWSTIAQKGINIRKAEVAGQKLKQVRR